MTPSQSQLLMVRACMQCTLQCTSTHVGGCHIQDSNLALTRLGNADFIGCCQLVYVRLGGTTSNLDATWAWLTNWVASRQFSVDLSSHRFRDKLVVYAAKIGLKDIRRLAASRKEFARSPGHPTDVFQPSSPPKFTPGLSWLLTVKAAHITST